MGDWCTNNVFEVEAGKPLTYLTLINYQVLFLPDCHHLLQGKRLEA